MSEPRPILPAGATAGDAPPPAAQPASVVRFCRTCGGAWDAAWTECPRCAPLADEAAASPGRPVLAGPLADYAQDIRHVKSSVLLYIALLAVCLIGALVATVNKSPLSVTSDVVLSSLISAIAAAWCLFDPAGILPLLRRTAKARWYALAAGSALLTYLLASGAMHVLNSVAELPEIKYLEPYRAAGISWGWAILLVCVQPAIFEELAFRGFIQTSLGRVIGPYEAVFASALMFGILHCSLPSLPHLLVLGVALALLRLKTASLYPGMLLHFSHNLLVLLSEHYGRITPW